MGAKILIAEDEPFIIESLAFLLSRQGHSVTSVTDGAAVMNAIETTSPDLLILDVMLPSANGFDILEKVRANRATATLPILALTAKGQEADRRRMLELGADQFMTKPFSNKDLVSSVERLLGGEAAEAGANRDDGVSRDRGKT